MQVLYRFLRPSDAGFEPGVHHDAPGCPSALGGVFGERV